MKRRNIFTFLGALFAALILATFVVAQQCGLAPTDAVPMLSVCVDWLTGFTGHTDGLALAVPAVLATRAGPEGDPATEAPEAAGVQLTDEQLQRVIQEIRGAAQPTEDDVKRILDSIAPERAPKEVDITPKATVQGDRVQHWKRRAVKYFDALALGATDSQRSIRLITELEREVTQMPLEQRRDEEAETKRIIDEAPLSRQQKDRLMEWLEVGPYTRLHTTSTVDAAAAGFLLPRPFLAELFVLIEQYGVCRRLFRAVPMTSRSISLKNVAGRPSVSWTNEGANIVASDAAFAEGTMTLNKLAGISSWTSELEEDQAIALLPTLIELFAESFSMEEDRAGLIGDGTPPFGGFTGLLNLPGATVVTLGVGLSTGAQLDEAGLRDAKNALTLARRTGARWFMHPTFHELIAQLQNAAGWRIFQENITGNAPDTLLGFPIEYSEVMPTVATVGANTRFMILGDPKRALMGQGRGITADISREAVLQDPAGNIVYNAYQADGALIRITERLAFATPAAVQPAFVVIQTAS